jgi:fructosamine-3-kinase
MANHQIRDLYPHIEAVLSGITGVHSDIVSSRSIGGGCINQAYLLETSHEQYFIKLNDAVAYPGMFEAEVLGLQLLSDAGAIRVPKPIAAGNEKGLAFLLLEYVPEGKRASDFWGDFGRSLAQLHRNTHEFFGLDHDNYIGSLPQSNRKEASWGAFLVTQRFEPQLKRAYDSGYVTASIQRSFHSLFNKLEELIPTEVPALIHGDLWSGNFMVTQQGNACIYDPAVYYGHREMDLAMSLLFGGFAPEFYGAYQEAFPMEANWRERMELGKLYPLLVHVNLFGEGYLGEVRSILGRFT